VTNVIWQIIAVLVDVVVVLSSPPRIFLSSPPLAVLSSPPLAATRTSMSDDRTAGTMTEAERNVERIVPGNQGPIEQAIVILGQTVNPVRVVGPTQIRELYARMGASSRLPHELNAFRVLGGAEDPRIYVNRDSAVFRTAARKPSALAILKLAATLAHEQVHNTDGELAACRLQADFVRSKLESLPRPRREDARAYLRELEAKIQALSQITQRRLAASVKTAAAARVRASRS
jgi:hypothetical protein